MYLNISFPYEVRLEIGYSNSIAPTQLSSSYMELLKVESKSGFLFTRTPSLEWITYSSLHKF